MTTKEKVIKAVEKHYGTALETAHFLHEARETANEEFKSSAYLADVLGKAGFSVEYPYFGFPTAFRGTLKNGEGESAAFLIEYDALPLIGHGCGHSLHGALSVLASLAMLELRDEFKGTIYAVGAPAEEQEGRKCDMAAGGVFDGFAFAGMMHCSSGAKSESGTASLGISQFNITFTGRPAHAAASPWEGISALACARKFLDLVDARRECFKSDMRFNAVFTNGGAVPNVIPENAVLKVDFRANCRENMDKMEDIMRKCANGAALAMDCKINMERVGIEYAAMKRDSALEEKMAQFMESYGIETQNTAGPLGSTDMANISHVCPSVHPKLSISKEFIPIHTKEFADAVTKPEAEETMKKGACALIEMALWCMKNKAK